MVRMVDVAKDAGVSVKTVSRVLNNEPHVKESLRQRIQESIANLGYVPSATARNLRSNRSYTIHLISNNVSSNFINAVQSGVVVTSQKLGYTPIFNYLEPKHAQDLNYLKNWCETLINDKKPDGIILMPPYTDNIHINEIIQSKNVAIARIGPNNIIDTNITIMIDDISAAKTATEHLIKLGHERIAFILGLRDHQATPKRFQGYSDALKDAGLPLDESLVFSGEFSFESGMLAGEKILKLDDRPTAIFAANDDMAAGFIVAAHKNNVSIPEDISVIGFDDSELSEKIWPPLTTIRQPRVGFGEKAAELLVKRQSTAEINNQLDTPVELLDYELIIRASTDKAKKSS